MGSPYSLPPGPHIQYILYLYDQMWLVVMSSIAIVHVYVCYCSNDKSMSVLATVLKDSKPQQVPKVAGYVMLSVICSELLFDEMNLLILGLSINIGSIY